MKSRDEAGRLRRRLLLAGIMALCALGLTVAERLVPDDTDRIVNNFAAAHSGSERVDAASETLLTRYGIDREAVTTWRVMTPERKLLRVEQRILVPPDFASVEFNHELNQQVLPFGARVTATERSKEKVVSMHILNRGVIIRTMSFAMRPARADGLSGQAHGTKKRTAH